MVFRDSNNATPTFDKRQHQAHMRRSRVPDTLRRFTEEQKTAEPSRGFTLRLNEYQLELLRVLAHAEYPRRSMQSVAIQQLVSALERAVEEL